ncbi:MAG: T9SS type A sorting domain-containing protein [Crocinitomicaceae bacterium]|nr:T9SS type A sorting domain-containing protein [Crocinitomicaceae bacterium]
MNDVQGQGIQRIEVYDLSGRFISGHQITGTYLTVELPDTPGLYFLKVILESSEIAVVKDVKW